MLPQAALQFTQKVKKMFKKLAEKIRTWSIRQDQKRFDAYFKDAQDIVDVERIVRELNRRPGAFQ